MTWRPYQTSWKFIIYFKKINSGGGDTETRRKVGTVVSILPLRQDSRLKLIITCFVKRNTNCERKREFWFFVLVSNLQNLDVINYISVIFLVIRTKTGRDGVEGGARVLKLLREKKLFVPLFNVRHWSHILTFLACFILTVYLHICSALYLSRIMSAPETNRRTGSGITYAVSQRVV